MWNLKRIQKSRYEEVNSNSQGSSAMAEDKSIHMSRKKRRMLDDDDDDDTDIILTSKYNISSMHDELDVSAGNRDYSNDELDDSDASEGNSDDGWIPKGTSIKPKHRENFDNNNLSQDDQDDQDGTENDNSQSYESNVNAISHISMTF